MPIVILVPLASSPESRSALPLIIPSRSSIGLPFRAASPHSRVVSPNDSGRDGKLEASFHGPSANKIAYNSSSPAGKTLGVAT